ncbi:MAG: helix-turn-helix domain-containing protein [Dehalococcoidia bacterium]
MFAGDQSPASGRPGATLTPQEKAQKARELHEQGFSYSQIAQQLGVARSTVVNYLKGYPYLPR